MAEADDFEVVQGVARVGEEGSEGFGGVENATPAEGDDEIVIAGRGADERERGLAGDGEGDGGNAGGMEGRAEGGGAVGRGSGDEEGAAAHGSGGGGDLLEGSLAEEDAGGGSEFKGWHGGGAMRVGPHSQDTTALGGPTRQVHLLSMHET